MNPEAELEFADVTFRYGEKPVLEGVTFEVGEGECVGMIGPNGGGKTTLIKLALGLLAPERGRIHVSGHEPHVGCRKVGYVPQQLHFDPKFPVTAGEVVLMGRLDRVAWWGRYRREDRETAQEAMNEVGLPESLSRPFAELSGGQRQRVLIARALVSEPEILLLDEPTANVDLSVEQMFLKTLDRLRMKLTIVMITHDLGLIERLTDEGLCVKRWVHRHALRDLDGETLREIYSGAQREQHFRPGVARALA